MINIHEYTHNRIHPRLPVLLIAIIITLTSSQQVVWNANPNIVADVVNLVVGSYKTSISSPVSYSVPYSISGASSTAACVSPSALSLPATNDLSFIIVKTLTTTSLAFTLTLFNSTILYSMDVYYIIINTSPGTTLYQLLSSKLTCAILSNGTGYRSETHSIPTSNPTYYSSPSLQYITVIQSFKMNTNTGVTSTIKSLSTLQSDLSVLSTFVTSDKNTFAQIVYCVIFYDQTTAYTTMREIDVMGLFGITPSTAPTTYLTVFVDTRYYTQTPSGVFFGLNGMNFTKANDKTLTYDPVNDAFTMSASFSELTLSYFFFVWRDCVAGTYFLKDFTTPANDDCVATCPILDRPFSDPVNSQCVGCYYTCEPLNCLNPGYDQCTSCDYTATLRVQTILGPGPFECACADYTTLLDVGVPLCQSCSVFVPGCDTCNATNYCLTCQAGFTSVSPTSCVCTTGFLLSGVCTTVYGCTSLSTMGGSPQCTSCNSTQLFVFSPNNFTCICMTGTILTQVSTNVYQCQGRCGDGYVMPTEGCDDGNNVGGDGCSGTCTVESGYLCVGVLSQGSTCKISSTLVLTLVDAIRDTSTNAAWIYLKVAPPDIHWGMVNLGAIFSTTIPSIPSSYILSYDNSGILSIYLSYTSSIQLTSQAFTFNLSTTPYFWDDTTVTVTDLSGSNCQLTFNTDLSFKYTLSYLLAALILLSWVTFIASVIFAQKWIGLQLIQTYQGVYFCLAQFWVYTYEFTPQFELLQFSNGYNRIINHNPIRDYTLTQALEAILFQKQFLLNFNIMALLILVSLIILSILAFIKRYISLKLQQRISQKAVKKKEQFNKIFNFFFSSIYLMLVFSCMFQVFFTFIIQMSSEYAAQRIFSDIINILIAIVFIGILFANIAFLIYWYILLPEGFKQRQRQGQQFMGLGFKKMKFSYPVLYISYQTLFILIISLTYNYQYGSIIVVPFQCIYFILLLLLRPYNQLRKTNNFIHNFTILFNQGLVIFISAISIYTLKAGGEGISQSMMTISSIITIVGLAGAVGLAITRIAIFNRNVGICYCTKKEPTQDKQQLNYDSMKKIIKQDNIQPLTSEGTPHGMKIEQKNEVEDKKKSKGRPQKKSFQQQQIEYNDRFQQFLTDKHVVWNNTESPLRTSIVNPNKRLVVASKNKTAISKKSTVQQFVQMQSKRLAQLHIPKIQQAYKPKRYQ